MVGWAYYDTVLSNSHTRPNVCSFHDRIVTNDSVLSNGCVAESKLSAFWDKASRAFNVSQQCPANRPITQLLLLRRSLVWRSHNCILPNVAMLTNRYWCQVGPNHSSWLHNGLPHKQRDKSVAAAPSATHQLCATTNLSVQMQLFHTIHVCFAAHFGTWQRANSQFVKMVPCRRLYG